MNKSITITRLIEKLKTELDARGDGEVLLIFKGKLPMFRGNKELVRDYRELAYWFNRGNVLNNFKGDVVKQAETIPGYEEPAFTHTYIPADEPKSKGMFNFLKIKRGKP